MRIGETIVYGGADQFHGYELWATDGTEGDETFKRYQ